MNSEIFTQVDNYVSDMFAPEDEALKQTVASIGREGIPQISVSANQGKFLMLMARICKATRILEVGTLAGYSTIWLGRSLPANGKLVSLELEEHHAQVAGKNIARAGLSEKVEIRTGKAMELLQEMISTQEEPFDLVFIDADKPPYAEYFELALKLSRPGTVIICDNVIREGKVLDAGNTDEKVIGVRRFNQALSKNTSVSSTIVSTVGVKEFDGMSISIVEG